MGGKRNNPAAAAEDWGRPAPGENSGQSTRGGMRGRGQDRGRGRGRGRGREERNTGRQQNDTATATATATETPRSAPILEMNGNADQTVTKPAAATGLVGYNSAESAEEGDGVSDSDSSSDSSSSSDEDEEPVKPAPAPAAKSSKAICKFFAKTGRCKMGQKCRFSHIVSCPLCLKGLS
jgi:hypothetical protein